MSPRVLTAAAVLTAALAGRASAQYPPPGSGATPGGFPTAPGDNPYFGAPTPPAFAPPPSDYPIPVEEGTYVPGAVLATESPGIGGTRRGPRGWVGAEYLFYWTKDAPLPVAVATFGPNGSSGAQGVPGTRTAVGGMNFDYTNMSGVRVFGGYWVTDSEILGIEGNAFWLPKRTTGTPRIIGNDLLPTLARPFFDTTTNTQSSRVLTRPGAFIGSIRTDATTEFWGGEIGPVWRAYDGGGRYTVDVLAGFKYLSLEESLSISDTATAQPGGLAVFRGRVFSAPASTTVTDQINTTNRFYGGVIGLRTNLHVEAFQFSVTGKLGLGEMEETVRAVGSTTLSGGPNPRTTVPGGFFAVPGSQGEFKTSQFTVIPEVNANLAVQVSSHLTISFGYSYLYVADVVRPGDQLNTRINSTQLPTSQNFGARSSVGTASPPLNSSSYWAQGFNLGLSIGY